MVEWRQSFHQPKLVREDESQWTKKRIKEEIKLLNQQAYEIRKCIRDLQGSDCAFVPGYEERIQKLNRRVRDYEWTLRAGGKADKNGIGNKITPQHIDMARQVSIGTFYNGKLRKAGKNSTGLCPFHEDRHASFTIYKSGQKYKCFSCGAQGDVIDFVQRTQNLKFPQAVKFILKI